MKSEIVDLNNELKRREKEEFYEDKLLELKMQEFLDKYFTENELSKYKNKLKDLKSEIDSEMKKKEEISEKISNIEKSKNDYEQKIKELDEKISEERNIQNDLDSQINSRKEFLQNMSKGDNLLNYINKNFSEEFKKEIKEICSKKVDEALKNNNSNSKNNANRKEVISNSGNKGNSKFTPVTGQREQFLSFSSNAQEQKNEAPSMNMNPMMPNPYGVNNPFMMYPMYMPMPQAMQMQGMNGYQNPFYFVPMPMNQNMQQKKDNHNKNK